MKNALLLLLCLAASPRPSAAAEGDEPTSMDPRVASAIQEVMSDKKPSRQVFARMHELEKSFPQPPKKGDPPEKYTAWLNAMTAFVAQGSQGPGSVGAARGPDPNVIALRLMAAVQQKIMASSDFQPSAAEGPSSAENTSGSNAAASEGTTIRPTTQLPGTFIPPNANREEERRYREMMARREFAKQYAAYNPGDAGAQRDFGEISYWSRDDVNAATHLRQAMDDGDTSANTRAMFGHAVYHLGDYEEAYKQGSTALEDDPNNEMARALVALAKGKVSSAHVADAIAKAGLSAPSRITANGDSPFGAGEASRQAAMMQSGAGLDPIEQQRRAELAAAAARQQVVPPTKIQQSAAVTKEAAHSLQIGDYPGAYTRATEAIGLNNQNAQAWNYRAMAASHMQRYSDAVYDASYSINLGSEQAPPYVTRSWAFSKQGKYKEAEQDARAALEKAPENAYAYHDLAYALAGEGKREEALAALQRAASQDSRFKDKYEKALQLAQNGDMTLLFADAPQAASGAAPAAGAPAAPSRGGRFLRLFLLTITGGLLVALGVLHVVSASWREKVNATVRRVLAATRGGASAQAPAQIEVRGTADGSAFWKEYEKVRELGAGGMGLVYEALDTSLGRPVAVKKMRDEIRIEPGERQRFIQEARMVAALHHPNIVDIYNIVEEGQDVFLVFEYVPGKTLSMRLSDGPLSFTEARSVLNGVCSAVDYAHSRKIIHRDLKPSNIMIREDGAVKVMDFGVARQAKDAMTKMSMTNTVVGTPPYMAPEQEQGTVRVESDVFALGVVLYECLCGELPFQGVGAGMLLNKINGKHEVLSKRCSQALPPGLDDVVAKALNPDPDKRYRTPKELMAALDALPVPSVA